MKSLRFMAVVLAFRKLYFFDLQGANVGSRLRSNTARPFLGSRKANAARLKNSLCLHVFFCDSFLGRLETKNKLQSIPLGPPLDRLETKNAISSAWSTARLPLTIDQRRQPHDQADQWQRKKGFFFRRTTKKLHDISTQAS